MAGVKKEEIILCMGHNSEYLKCNGNKKENTDFYNSWSPFKGNGKVDYCKDCVQKIYEYYLKLGSMQAAIYYTCQVLDVAFIAEIYEKVNNRIKEGKKTLCPFTIYITELQKYTTKKEIWYNFSCSDVDLADIDTRIKTNEVKKKEVETFEMNWGKQDIIEDYSFLQDTFERYTDGVEFVNAQQIDLYRDLCRDRLLLRKINDNRYKGQEDIDKIQKRIASTMSTLKVSDFESNKPKTVSEQSLFEKIRLCDENNVKDIYKEPTRYIDHNKYMKYEKDMVLRPLLKTLVGHRDFNIDMDDLEAYNLDEK